MDLQNLGNTACTCKVTSLSNQTHIRNSFVLSTGKLSMSCKINSS
jgi:hypothetical protein